jgi:Ring finger domain
MFTMSEPEWEGTNHSAISSTNDNVSSPTSEESANRYRDPFHMRIRRLIVKSFMVLLFVLPSLIIISLILVICMVPIVILILTACVLCIVRPEQVMNSFGYSNMNERRDFNRRWDFSVDWVSGNPVSISRSREALEKMLDIRIVQDLEFSSTKRSFAPLNDNDAQPTEKHIHTDIPNDSREISSLRSEGDPIIVSLDSDGEYGMEEGGSIARLQQHEHKSPESPMDISIYNSSCDDKNEDDIESHPPSTILLDMKSNPSCDICLMDYQVGDEVTISHNPECSHIFHKECILEWVRKRQTCPCCRRNYLRRRNSKRLEEQGSEVSIIGHDDLDSIVSTP